MKYKLIFFMVAISLIVIFSYSSADDLLKIPLKASLTKKTKSFQIKNLFSFQLPDNIPSNINFRGLVGKLSTTTSPDPLGQKPVWSETLFGLAYTTGAKCPISGQKIGSYAAISSTFPSQGLVGLIMKQAGPGTETMPVAIRLPVGLPIHLISGGCLYMTFDGTDFANRPYTMTSDLSLLYDVQSEKNPSYSIKGLDAEFLISPSTGRGKKLNAYSVIPVSPYGPIRPGQLLAVYGNVSATSSIGFFQHPVRNGHWSIRNIIAVYQNGSCAKVFPGHASRKFLWNDQSGNGSAQNPSAVFWKTSYKILDISLNGIGIDSVMRQANATLTVPIPLHDGDCIVSAVLPNSVDPDIEGAVNVEVQITAASTP